MVMTLEPTGAQGQNLTRKQRRQQQLQEKSDNESKDIQSSLSNLSIALTMSAPLRLLVCSIGNPAPYTNTFHSAGHIVNNILAQSLSYPSFQRSREYGKGLVSTGFHYTLWQSSSYMNVSGDGVAAAWRQFSRDARGEEVALVVLHDELELGLGQVKVKGGDMSPKGHNGLKSIKERLQGTKWTRIGVGIGRPESREKNDVANYVLQKMNGAEKAKIEGAVGRVLDELGKLSGR
jgi:PTH1 family peptidyl-tRNA hydrolase